MGTIVRESVGSVIGNDPRTEQNPVRRRVVSVRHTAEPRLPAFAAVLPVHQLQFGATESEFVRGWESVRFASRDLDGTRNGSMGPKQHAAATHSVDPRPDSRLRAVLQRGRLRETIRIATRLRELEDVQRVCSVEAGAVHDADAEVAASCVQARGVLALRVERVENVQAAVAVLQRRGSVKARVSAAACQQRFEAVAECVVECFYRGSGERVEGECRQNRVIFSTVLYNVVDF